MEALSILNSALQREDSINIEATVVTGFEFLALEECKEKCQPYDIKKAKGRVFFNLPKEDYLKVFSLRAVDNVYLLCQAIPTLSFKKDKENDLEVVKDIVNNVDWNVSLEKWANIKSFKGNLFPKPEEAASDDVLKFRVTCNRVGKHSFSSMEAARDFGGLLNDNFHWKVNLTNFDLEVVLNITDNAAYVCAALTRQSLHRRNISHFSDTTLRATMSYCLLRLAEPVAGEIVLDPLCGIGSIPLEGSLGFPYTYNIGGDIKKKSIVKARKNLIHLGGNWVNYLNLNHSDEQKDNSSTEETTKKVSENAEGNLSEAGSISGGELSETEETPKERKFRTGLKTDFLRWSVKRLPLKDSSVDIFVTDLPFGKRSGKKPDNRRLYNSVMFELARIVRPKSGRASILTADKYAMTQAINQNSEYWKQIRTFTINQGGIYASVYLLLRSAKQFHL